MTSQSTNPEVKPPPEQPSEAPRSPEIMTDSQPSTSSSPSSSASATKHCATCSKEETDPEKPLKACSKCQSVHYCSRDCQKADFKKHKKVCAEKAQVYAQNADLKMAAPRAPKKEGHRGGLQKWQFDT